MRIKSIILVVVLAMATSISFGQHKSKKQLREERRIAQFKKTELLIGGNAFIFIARNCSPLGFTNIDLTNNSNYLRFEPELITSEMPFFGTSYRGLPYGGDAGLHFKGMPQEYSVKKLDKYYEISTVVKDRYDAYRLLLTVFYDGSATLLINSNNRSSISYNSDIRPLQKK